MNESPKTIRSAVVDLFAGLRTVHLASKGTGIDVVLSYAAKKCQFANDLAAKNEIKEQLMDDVKKMDKHWAKRFVDEAIAAKAELIILIGGFPCKGLSKARGEDRENLENKDSNLFFDLLRVLQVLRAANSGNISIAFVVENVLMDEQPLDLISSKLGCRPVLIGATPTCGARRDRLFWCNFPIEAGQGETLTKDKKTNTLLMKKDPTRSDFWDAGWGPAPNFQGYLPTLQGWRSWTSQPKDPRGITKRSSEAKARWKADKWSSAITFYEDYNMAHNTGTPDAPEQRRHISPTEAERLLCFPYDWTRPSDSGILGDRLDSQHVANLRRNAVGNAFAVPVIRRILMGLCVAVQSKTVTGTGLWQDRSLAAPFHPDVLDDILPQAQCLAEAFLDLTADFDNYLPPRLAREASRP